MTSFKQKGYLKDYAINQKIYLYKKNNESTQHINKNINMNGNFPIDLLNKQNNNKYTKYYNKNKNNIINSMNNNYINNNKNINTSVNSNNKSINISKKPLNKNAANKNNFIYYNSKNKNKKQAVTFTNTNNSISYNYNNASKIKKMSKIPQGANPVNTYIINTLNVSEKDFINTGLSSAKPDKTYNESAKDLQNEINNLIKEKEENKSLIKKQKKLIEKFEEDNDNLENRINLIEHENKKIKAKIDTYTENQEQLIMLIKIVQKSGVDVEALIDKWNEEVENMNEENEISENNINLNNNKESISDEISELNGKIDPSSFIPINIEEPHVNKKVFKGIPKLNFSNINTKETKKGKFKNNSK